MTHSEDTYDQSDSDLTLQVLGGAALRKGQPSRDARHLLGAGKPLALVFYLLESPSRSAERDYLIELLWSDRTAASAQHSLRQTVWHINNHCGRNLITTRDRITRLATDIHSDLAAFRCALEDGHHEKAVDLYRGDVMPNVAFVGGGEFERWLEGERQRARGLFVRALDAVIRTNLSSGRFRDAEKLARRWKDTDELNETAWRRLLEVLVSAGDDVRAAHAADEFTFMLDAEGREPEAASRVAIDSARKVMPMKSQPGRQGIVVDTVGRETQFQRMIQAWEHARAGHGQHVHVVAPPGLGKTRLLTDLSSRLRATGCRCVVVRANQGDRNIAYALASEVAGAMGSMAGAGGVAPATAGVLVDLNASLSSLYTAVKGSETAEEKLRRRAEALCELTRVVADERPIALLVDDLHWSDPDSAIILQRLITSVRNIHALLVTTARPTVSLDPSSPSSIKLQLDALETEQTAMLLNGVAMLPAEDWAKRLPGLLREATDGSPLLIVETVQLAESHGLLVVEDATWACPDFPALTRELCMGEAMRARIDDVGDAGRWILLVASIAGVPLATDTISDILPATIADPFATLDELERKGLLARTLDGWTTAHDEVASVAVRAASRERTDAAHASLGHALAKTAASDTRSIKRSAVHLLAAQDWQALRGLFFRWVRRQRRLGNHSPLAELAAELLTGQESTQSAARLVEGTPWLFRIRHGRYTVPAVATLTGLSIVASSAAFILRQRTPDEAFRIAVWQSADTSHTVDLVDIDVSHWNPATPLELAGRRKQRLELGFRPSDMIPAPHGNAWATVGAIPGDTGGVDIVIVNADGTAKRITAASSHDDWPSWSPDAKALAFQTTRWTNRAEYDIAIVDLTTGAIRPLVISPFTEMHPSWSPDGTKIGFTRSSHDGYRFACWATVDGINEDCVALKDGYSISVMQNWTDLHHRIARVTRAGSEALASIDIRTGDVAISSDSSGLYGILSHDGNWFIRRDQPVGYDQAAWFMSSVSQPDAVRQITNGGLRSDQFNVGWADHAPPRIAYLDTLSIGQPPQTVTPGTPHRLKVRGRDAHGGAVQVLNVRWSSSDTTVAQIDTSGVLWPMRLGTAVVTVSAGGWRQDAVSITVAESMPSTVLTESWQNDIARSWIAYGHPKPYIVSSQGGVRAFFNNGDGNFPSGAYSKTLFSPKRGIGLRTLVSAPTSTSRGYQDVEIMITSSLDSVGLAHWDHTTNGPPTIDDDFNSCGLKYPRAGPITNERKVAVFAAGQRETVDAPAQLIAGEWTPVLLQILSDGTCAILINGDLIWHSTQQVRVEEEMRVVLQGATIDSNILVGPLEVWEGVARHINWIDQWTAKRGER